MTTRVAVLPCDAAAVLIQAAKAGFELRLRAREKGREEVTKTSDVDLDAGDVKSPGDARDAKWFFNRET